MEVIIIGGGPAGSAMGWFLSQANIPNLIIESANHPRPHVGESMVTASTRIFDEMGFLPTMEREGFVRKYGASWHPPQRRASVSIEFSEFPQPGVNQDYTYQVDRSRFDLALLKHAEQAGSQVMQGVRVREAIFEDGCAKGVRLGMNGTTVDIPAKCVIDASGRRTLVGSQLGIKKPDELFNQFAVHGWFEGVDRGERPDDIHIHFLPIKRGWVWQIPITDTVTSIGVVAEKDDFKKGKGDYGAWFKKLTQSAPDIANGMENATPVNELKVEADYSYAMERFVGDGFMLLGDAARFVDPIFSSGVSVALYSAKFASEVLIPALQVNDVSEAALKPYETRLKKGTKVWYEFIRLYYKLLPLFTHFIESPEHRHDLLRLLQGDVYDRDEVQVLDAMRNYIRDVESTDGHLLARHLDETITV